MTLYEKLIANEESLSLVGLGYVGMPIAHAFAKKGLNVIGFDLNKEKIDLYKSGIDPTKEIGDEEILKTKVLFTSNEKDLQKAKFHIVSVPTPVNTDHTPDLTPVIGASEIVGRNLVPGYIQEIDSYTKEKISERKVPLEDSQMKKYVKTRSPFNHVKVMFKKKDILKIGGYEELYLMEDYLLWIKAVENKLKFCNIPKVLVNMRINDNLYIRRSGYKYFKSNKNIFDRLLKTKSINIFTYLFNITVCFIIQVLMPNSIKTLFYKKVLR